MSITVPLPHPAIPHRRPDGFLSRARVRARRDALDRRLAAGVDPTADEDLRVRAAQLSDPETRRRIAMVIDRLLDEAAGPPAPFSSKVPLARAATVACAPRLCEIAGRLEGGGALATRGIAQAAMLIRRPDSPLFSAATVDTDLNHHLAAILVALRPA
jgi:hypothetical protein